MVADVVDGMRYTSYNIGRFEKQPDHAFDDVVDIGEIPHKLPTFEDMNGFTLEYLLGEAEVRHVRAAPGPVDSKKTQRRGRHLIQVTKGIGKQFVGLLGCRIQRNRRISPVILAERNLADGAVDAAAACVQ